MKTGTPVLRITRYDLSTRLYPLQFLFVGLPNILLFPLFLILFSLPIFTHRTKPVTILLKSPTSLETELKVNHEVFLYRGTDEEMDESTSAKFHAEAPCRSTIRFTIPTNPCTSGPAHRKDPWKTKGILHNPWTGDLPEPGLNSRAAGPCPNGTTPLLWRGVPYPHLSK